MKYFQLLKDAFTKAKNAVVSTKDKAVGMYLWTKGKALATVAKVKAVYGFIKG
jgi:hypothetical protein